MCCGQHATRLDDAAARALYARYLAGVEKRLLCAVFRIGTPEYERVVREGQQRDRLRGYNLVEETVTP